MRFMPGMPGMNPPTHHKLTRVFNVKHIGMLVAARRDRQSVATRLAARLVYLSRGLPVAIASSQVSNPFAVCHHHRCSLAGGADATRSQAQSPMPSFRYTCMPAARAGPSTSTRVTSECPAPKAIVDGPTSIRLEVPFTMIRHEP